MNEKIQDTKTKNTRTQDEDIQDTRKRKKFEELTIADDFMFAKVMLNEELCRRLLEMILSVKIQKITYLQEQKTIDNDYDAKSVRLDVYVDDEKGTVYDIEMQAGTFTPSKISAAKIRM